MISSVKLIITPTYYLDSILANSIQQYVTNMLQL